MKLTQLRRGEAQTDYYGTADPEFEGKHAWRTHSTYCLWARSSKDSNPRSHAASSESRLPKILMLAHFPAERHVYSITRTARRLPYQSVS
jgi:hypothetical protein